MKLRLSCAPSSAIDSSRRTILRKLVSTLVTTAAVAGGILPLKDIHTVAAPVACAADQSGDEAPLGLSRRRGAFVYAIDLLAGASSGRPDLASYYQGLAKRLEGQSSNGDDGSGIYVVKPEPRTDAPVIDNTPPKGRVTLALSLFGLLAGITDLAKGPALPSFLTVKTLLDMNASPLQGPVGGPVEAPKVSRTFTAGDLAFEMHPEIRYWMDYYSTNPVGRRTMTIGIQRCNDYLQMARDEFRRAGVPEDLVWLAFVESVWNPRAVSPAAAGGIWQFITPTATDYGLKVKCGDDERADPVKQTKVAAVYLRDLYTIFGDWALAMAAYNSGEPRVMGAIIRNGRANFWDLCDKQLLPKETRDYVPKILAAIKIAGGARDYGLIDAETPASGGS